MDIEIENNKSEQPIEIVSSSENGKTTKKVQKVKCGQNLSELLATYFKW